MRARRLEHLLRLAHLEEAAQRRLVPVVGEHLLLVVRERRARRRLEEGHRRVLSVQRRRALATGHGAHHRHADALLGAELQRAPLAAAAAAAAAALLAASAPRDVGKRRYSASAAAAAAAATGGGGGRGLGLGLLGAGSGGRSTAARRTGHRDGLHVLQLAAHERFRVWLERRGREAVAQLEAVRQLSGSVGGRGEELREAGIGRDLQRVRAARRKAQPERERLRHVMPACAPSRRARGGRKARHELVVS